MTAVAITAEARESESRIREALLTMDVVDQLRHHRAELERLASSDDLQIKRRLAEIYRAQGIEVSDDILDAGIKARRDQRYVHRQYRGPLLYAAKFWIARRAIARGAGIAAMSLAGIALIYMGVYHFPREYIINNRIEALNAAAEAVRIEASILPGALQAEAEEFQRARDSALGANVADRDLAARIRPTAAALESDLQVAQIAGRKEISRLAAIIPQPLTRATYDRKDDAVAALDESTGIVAQARGWIGASDQAAQGLLDAVSINGALELANSELIKRTLSPEMDAARASAYAAGVAAMLAAKPDAAETHAQRLQDMAADFALFDEYAIKLDALYQKGLATGPRDEASSRLQADRAAVVSALTPTTMDKARDAMASLEATVSLLSAEYLYRIVSRPGVQSGVWRYSHDARNVRNHYLIVEALDPAGQVVTIPVRNEETGDTESVAIFGVRVTEDEFERVKADKMDNGIIDRAVIGHKPRGALTPTYDVKVAGGDITAW